MLMKNLKNLFLLLVLIGMSGSRASAHDIVVTNDSGDKIYYNFNGSGLTVTYKGDNYYDSYEAYSGNIIIPEEVQYAGNYYNVTGINEYAFYGCSGLTSITIPRSVTNIGYYAFSGCTQLGEIIVESGNSYYDSRENCNAIISTQNNSLITGCRNTVIPNSVTSISENAFYNCTSLTSIDIPNSVTIIGVCAFGGCNNLSIINIPNTITSIGEDAFNGTPWYNNKPDGIVYAGKIAYKYKGTMPEETSLIVEDGTISINEGAFRYCNNLVSIDIPSSVTSIGGDAFYGCSNLSTVNIPSSITNVGDNAFNGTPWYNNKPDGVVYIGKVVYKYKGTMPEGTSVIIDDGMKTINNFAFYNCSNLISLTIPSSITNIGSGAFYGCNSITTLTIGMQDIGTWFQGKSSLKNLILTDGVISISSNAFSNCSNLINVTIPSSVTTIGSNAFSGTPWYNNKPDGLIYLGKVAFKYKGTMPDGTTVVLDEGTTGIGASAFYGCTGLNSIVIPNSVTNIGGSAFRECSNLTSVIIPNGITTIEPNTFYYCSKLNSITIPNSVTAIGNYAFSRSGLTSIEIPSSVTKIGYDAFSSCPSLNSATIPNSVKSVGSSAFSSCYKLQSLTIGVPVIGDWFRYCPNITTVTLTDGVKTIEKNAFYDCGKLASLTIPSSVTEIADGAFANCYNIRALTIGTPNIGYWFSGKNALTTLVLTDGVTSIGNSAFYNCTGLTSIEIPNSVTSISYSAFGNCSNLNLVFMQPVTPPSVSSGTSFPSNTVFIVPNSSLTAYKGAQGWETWKSRIFTKEISYLDITVAAKNDRSDIHAVIGEENLENVVSLKLSGTINGYDVMLLRDKMPNIRILDLTDASIVASNYEYYTGYTKTYDNVLPAYMFGNQSKWTEVKLPSTLVGVGDKAFYGTKITSIAFPTGIKSIGSEAFYNSSISSVDLSGTSIKSIGNNAFYNCKGLNSADFSNSSIQSIGNYAFYNCEGLNSADFSNSSIQSIGNYAFNYCNALTSVDLSNSAIQSIGSYAFYYCGITSVDLSNSAIQSIGSYAFSNTLPLLTCLTQPYRALVVMRSPTATLPLLTSLAATS